MGVLYDSLQTLERTRALSDAYLEAGGTGPRILIRRVWIGPAPTDNMAAQMERYRGYAPQRAVAGWGEDDSLIAGADGAEVAERLHDAMTRTGCDVVNVRVFLAGLTPAQVHEQIASPRRRDGAPPAPPAGPVNGRVAIVAARPGPLGSLVAAALSDAGAAVSVIAPPFADREAAAGALAVAARPDVVVWADVDPDGLRPDPVVGLGEPDWDRRCEEPIRSALWLLQAAYPHLKNRDGRVVLVCPSVALEGAAGLVPLATAAEGQRLLAKAVARRWGGDGITVNVVTVPVAALDPASPTRSPTRCGPSPPSPGPTRCARPRSPWPGWSVTPPRVSRASPSAPTAGR